MKGSSQLLKKQFHLKNVHGNHNTILENPETVRREVIIMQIEIVKVDSVEISQTKVFQKRLEKPFFVGKDSCIITNGAHREDYEPINLLSSQAPGL